MTTLRTTYPSERFVIIGLGRSPDPLIVWLNELDNNAAFSVAASGLRSEELRQPLERINLLRPQLSRVARDGRDRVAIDYVSRGVSLITGTLLMARADADRVSSSEGRPEVQPRWHAVGLVPEQNVRLSPPMLAEAQEELSQRRIHFRRIPLPPALDRALSGEELKGFSAGPRQGGHSEPETRSTLEARGDMLRYAIRSFRANRSRTSLSTREILELGRDLSRYSSLPPERQMRVAELIFYTFHPPVQSLSPPSGQSRLAPRPDLGSQQAELCAILLKNPDILIPGTRRPLSLLATVMDQVGAQISRAPDGPFSRRLADLISQQAGPQRANFARILESLHLPNQLLSIHSSYRRDTHHALNAILLALSASRGFEPSAFLESKIQREWFLAHSDGAATSIWTAMDQAGVQTWMRWYQQATTEQAARDYRRYFRSLLDSENLAGTDRMTLESTVQLDSCHHSSILRDAAAALREY